MSDNEIYIRVDRPEGYEDVCDQLLFEDFLESPKNPIWNAEEVTDFVNGMWMDLDVARRNSQ